MMFEVIAFLLIMSPDADWAFETSYRLDGFIDKPVQKATRKLQIVGGDEDRLPLGLIRDRYKLLIDTPTIEHADLFPCDEAIEEILRFNTQFANYLMEQIVVGNPNAQQVLDETCDLQRLWKKIQFAKDKNHYLYQRRLTLLEIRGAMGSCDFYSGVMPPSVPIKYFSWRP